MEELFKDKEEVEEEPKELKKKQPYKPQISFPGEIKKEPPRYGYTDIDKIPKDVIEYKTDGQRPEPGITPEPPPKHKNFPNPLPEPEKLPKGPKQKPYKKI